MDIFNIAIRTIQGETVSLESYKGKVLLIVNTASKCGYTPQYEALQGLYEKYKEKGLVVLGFPCNQFGGQEPGTNEEVDAFCKVNYGVSFPLFEKVEVKGDGKHPLFAFLTEEAPFEGFDQNDPGGRRFQAMFEEHMPEQLQNNEIKWNFTKFLVSRDGNSVGRYEPIVSPSNMEADIEALL